MPILIIGGLLIFYGIAAVFSVSTYESFSLTLKLGDPSNYFYFLRHLKNILIAIISAICIYRIPVNFFQKQKNIWIVTIIVFILQILVFIPGIGAEYNGSRGWIDIQGLPSIQPCEFFKLGYVLFMAGWLVRKRKTFDNDKQMLLSYIVINIIFLVIFCFIPDFGSALVMGVTGVVMALYSGMDWKKIAVVGACGIGCAILFGSLASVFSNRFSYLQERITYFLGSSNDDSDQGVGWQNQQALAAIGGGGFWGHGYGKGLQKFGYIPEAQSDFIFAAFSEEVGFVGDILLIGLYFYLMFYVMTRLKYVSDEYGKVIAVGLLSLLIMQALINMFVNTKLLPNTGLTLPFISHGGTALMVNCISLILIYKIIENK